jgi:hypothetical protein
MTNIVLYSTGVWRDVNLEVEIAKAPFLDGQQKAV